MARKPTPQQPTVDDNDLPQTAVRERTHVTQIRLMNSAPAALAEFAEDEGEPSQAHGNWEKRYGDLRRHTQQLVSEKDRSINDLTQRINQLETTLNRPMPRTKQELEEWKEKYPEIKAIMEALIDERASLQTRQVKEELQTVQGRLSEAERQRAFAQLKALVPDLEDVLGSEGWKEWFATFPDSVQDQINKSDDPHEVAKMVNKYKETNVRPQPARPQSDRTSVLDSAVRNTGSTPPSRQQTYKFTESQIKAMSPKEFERLETEIDDARRKGLVLRDGQRKVYHTDY